MKTLTEKVIRNFKKKVSKRPHPKGCWEWTGSAPRYGYAWDGERVIPAHRLSWLIYRSRIPKDKDVCHKCDNPLCVRPSHLFLGKKSENVRDSISKGRWKVPGLKGEEVWCAKLTDVQIRRIRRMKNRGVMNQTQIASLFGVGPDHVSRIVRRLVRKSA